jgi:hypothetical protein
MGILYVDKKCSKYKIYEKSNSSKVCNVEVNREQRYIEWQITNNNELLSNIFKYALKQHFF